ncbi:MAG: hypothetical protein WC545_02570 [Patescibacteria group bacterium]
MIRRVEKIDDLVPIKNVVISVSDKRNLDVLAIGLLKYCPGVKIYASGGTHEALKALISPAGAEQYLCEISEYTGQPETEGGLVKTLHHKLFLGYLTETYCSAHQNDLAREKATPIDLVVINLYPFKKTIAKPETTFEDARGNIDVGGPSALRAAAKNFLRVMTCVNPEDYNSLADELEMFSGFISLNSRIHAAKRTFKMLSEYDSAIAKYLGEANICDIMNEYDIV